MNKNVIILCFVKTNEVLGFNLIFSLHKCDTLSALHVSLRHSVSRSYFFGYCNVREARDYFGLSIQEITSVLCLCNVI